MQKRSKIYKRY